MRDLHAVYAERRAQLVEVSAALQPYHHEAVLAIIEECDRRMSGDTGALAGKSEVRSRINRVVAEVLEVTLQAFDARGHCVYGSTDWLLRKDDITAVLAGAEHPTRSARKLVALMLTYGDFAGVEVLTSGASRVWLHALDIDLRALQVAAVRWLVADRERAGLDVPPSARFCLAQETDASLAELVTFASFLVPHY